MRTICTLLLALLLASSVSATTINVPADQPTIQAGIDAAVNGDTVLVADGTYTGTGNRDMNYNGKAIVVMSANGPEVTIIDLENSGRAFYFGNGEDSTSILSGFTIRDGNTGGNHGAAIRAQGGSPSIGDCVFENNTASHGGAVYANNVSELRFSGCWFKGNSASGEKGGAVFVQNENPSVFFENCLFSANVAPHGGALLADNEADITLNNCTFVLNSADEGAAIWYDDNAFPIQMANCILAYSTNGEAVYCETSESPFLSCCNLYGNSGGDWVGAIASQATQSDNFSADPRFCDTASGNFAISHCSQCSPLRSPCGTLVGAIGVGCDSSEYCGPVWHVAVDGSDSTGDGTEQLPFLTIQRAIDMSWTGDTVLIHPGTYGGIGNAELNPLGKDIVVRSVSGAQSTTIVCDTIGTGFRLENQESADCRIEGLTVIGREEWDEYVGGGVRISDASPTIADCVFRDGGGLFGHSELSRSSAAFIRCEFRDHYMYHDKGLAGVEGQPKSIIGGGAIAIDDNSSVIFQECSFTDNTNAIDMQTGGAVVGWNSDLTFERCSFTNNEAVYGVQGGAVAAHGGAIRFDSCQFSQNMASHVGCAGVYLGTSCAGFFDSCAFIDNSASMGGVAVLCQDAVSVVLNSCLFAANSQWSYGGEYIGSVVHAGDAVALLSNCTFAGNYAENEPWVTEVGVLGIWNGASTISECVIAFNRGADYTVIADESPAVPTVSCCNVYGNEGGDYTGSISGMLGIDGNLSADPLFCDTTNGDYGLDACSPCAPERNSCGTLIGALVVACSSAYCGSTWHVATVGNDSLGDGSESAPFATIQRAVDAAVDGDTVLMGDGTYTGSGNRDVVVESKSLVVRSVNGSELTTIDCQADSLDRHRAFSCLGNSTHAVTIDGFSIINGYAPDSTAVSYPSGSHAGGIEAVRCSLTVSSCRFSSCYADYGAAISMEGAPMDITNATFSSNDTDGGTVHALEVELTMVSCSSSCSSGIGLRKLGDMPLTLAECVFQGTADRLVYLEHPGVVSVLNCDFIGSSGEGFYFENRPSDCSFESSSFVRNGAYGLHFKYSTGQAVLQDCRFSDNGGGVYAVQEIDEADLLFEDCVFDGNASVNGGAIRTVYTFYVVCRRCTFVNNQFSEGATILFQNAAGTESSLEECIIANCDGTAPIYASPPDWEPELINLQCCNIYGNPSGDYVGVIADQAGINGNFSLDPLFCDTANGDFSLYDLSPCAPGNNSCSTLIGALGVSCYVADVDSITVDTTADNQHVLSPLPLIQWRVTESQGPQERFEIAVGTDDDWEFAEMWNPAPFVSSDTQVVYAGAALVDGARYYLRLRVNFGVAWSPWYETTFRMNTPPGAPDTLAPDLWSSTDGLVTLWLANAVDAENDPLVYEIEGFHDTDCVFGPQIDSTGIPENDDSTGVFYNLTAAENCLYCWHARAYDGFEYGEWSSSSCFYVDAVAEAPTAPEPIYPVEPQYGVLYDMRPEFLWARGRDGDPGDTVWHRLEVAIDRNFAFVQTVDSLHDNRYTLPDSLEFDTRYWWRVTGFDMDGFESVSPAESLWTWTLGDIDRSHEVGLGDLTVLIDHLFVSFDPIEPPRVGDLSGDCTVSLGDLTLMIDHLFVSFADFTTPGCDPVIEKQSEGVQEK